MASPDLTMDTPQLPFWYFSPLYTQPGNKEENISEGCASYMINSHTALTSSSISEGVAVAEWSKVLLKREKINENQKDPRSATRPGQSLKKTLNSISLFAQHNINLAIKRKNMGD